VSTVVPSFDTFAPEGLSQSPKRRSSSGSHSSSGSIYSARSPTALTPSEKKKKIEEMRAALAAFEQDTSETFEVETQSQTLSQDAVVMSPSRPVRGSKRVAAQNKSK
jgi:hypothetical protein